MKMHVSGETLTEIDWERSKAEGTVYRYVTGARFYINGRRVPRWVARLAHLWNGWRR